MVIKRIGKNKSITAAEFQVEHFLSGLKISGIEGILSLFSKFYLFYIYFIFTKCNLVDLHEHFVLIVQLTLICISIVMQSVFLVALY